jgi:hypothetical protein
MPTPKQKIALDKMVENGGNVSKAMVEAGYSQATAKTPQKLTESQGFRELCEQYGLTDNLIINALVDDINSKPGNRKPELELAAKLRGRLTEKHEHSGTVKVQPILQGISKNVSINDSHNEAIEAPQED